MEEKAQFETRRSKIILDLPHRSVVEGSRGFYFDHQLLVDYHVETLSRHLLT